MKLGKFWFMTLFFVTLVHTICMIFQEYIANKNPTTLDYTFYIIFVLITSVFYSIKD